MTEAPRHERPQAVGIEAILGRIHRLDVSLAHSRDELDALEHEWNREVERHNALVEERERHVRKLRLLAGKPEDA